MMRHISGVLNDVLKKLVPADWVAEGWEMVTCPFHKENTASMALHAESGEFKCLECLAKGQVIDGEWVRAV